MEVNFKKFNINHCRYCENRDTNFCDFCLMGGKYIPRPTYFEGTTEMAKLYFELLEDYSQMMHLMGFRILK